ncbi:CheR family methyltransferase [Desulfobacula phenolica]|uniref:protein-glutamate O-methyltransferase n=1 Tax=Desulfobacula phenolica TaxID=90732 RepID=A0A1H2HW61_9BACT|nr:protein-glutamate O-methyltransferase CheR [Desulfobacula phenolica]SDU36150.1 chemotaxis protein methyltransferase CheR [Desulfobacula phenolica]
MRHEFESILCYLNKTHGFDFSANRYSSLERKINNRTAFLKIMDAQSYIRYVEAHPEELITLIDLLTINVSRFFRNTLTFELIAKKMLPAMIAEKIKTNDPCLRVWSAGCAEGEEPYSIAILINEIMEKEKNEFDINIFATDINKKILQKAREGIYHFDQIKDIKHGLLCKYFTIKDDTYILSPKIKKMVDFSFYNVIDPKTYVPPESVFGNFDLVLCRNLLIYFKAKRQSIIFDKLIRSLSQKGCLVLGKAEKLPVKFKKYFSKENNYGHIHLKYS